MIKFLKKVRFLNILRNKLEKYPIVQMIISEVYKKRISKIKHTRYQDLFNLIKQQRSRIILEIGVFDGITAYKKIKLALKFHPANRIEYYGFDLFEEISEAEIIREVSKKPLAFNVIKGMLEKTGVNIHLYKGNTLETLPIFMDMEEIKNKDFDFILIDGGHSIGTITSDWNNVSKLMNQNTLVIFDDYYT